ncbi:MAG: M20/M25/M40 family metallo-hydrolase, partial [Ignavibacteria bacterium]
ARNVVGILEGKDEKLKDEYIVLSAHYDHLGKRGNDIYNGADDDGSGTVTILDAARTLSIKKENKRSILFVFHTGEEKGLLGSRYFTEHFGNMDAIKANINIDMVGRGSVDTIYNIGSGKLSSEFYELVKNANEESVNIYFDYRFDDPNDPNRFYYRSDHINYARKGIPIVFFYDYMQKDYHKPTDTVEKINWEKIVKMVELTHTIALKTANLDTPLIIDKNE